MSKLFIEWKDDYLIGHPIIDFEHQSLVNITNNLFQAVHENRESKAIGAAIRHLISYVERHFEREELIFSETDYPDREPHMKMHRDIEQVVRGIADQYQTDPTTIDIDEVLNFLKKWLIDHIAKNDRAYLPYINI